MRALGLLEEAPPSDLFTAEANGPIRPGNDSPPLLATKPPKKPQPQKEADVAAVVVAAERDRDRARDFSKESPSTGSLAVLAQAHAVLGERSSAIAAARTALELSGREAMRAGETSIGDPVSARLAAEVMLRFGEASAAYDLLLKVPLTRSLRITLATIAIELERWDEAMRALDGQDGASVESFRGFLLALKGEYQQAIPHLRAALREAPDDADAAMNLSVSLWRLGARRKAVATALRASRSAPGRKDLSLHYLELLLAQGDIARVDSEIAALDARNVVPDAHFLVIKARARLAKDELPRAVPLLVEALKSARAEGDVSLRAEIAANLAALRFRLGQRSYDETMETLSELLRESPSHEAVVMTFARTAMRASHATELRRAVDQVSTRMPPPQRAFLRHQVALLEGDNKSAASAAAEWFDLEPSDPLATGTAIVALGIGQERWKEAEKVADFALSNFPDEPSLVNNAAYVLAMAGRAAEAIRLLAPLADNSFVPKATLGLAYLAEGDIDQGMRLYREAAEQAEKENSAWRSLMTTYQALIVRQLGIDKSERPEILTALALPPFPLPPDWRDHPDFLRLHSLCQERGYDWPLCL